MDVSSLSGDGSLPSSVNFPGPLGPECVTSHGMQWGHPFVTELGILGRCGQAGRGLVGADATCDVPGSVTPDPTASIRVRLASGSRLAGPDLLHLLGFRNAIKANLHLRDPHSMPAPLRPACVCRELCFCFCQLRARFAVPSQIFACVNARFESSEVQQLIFVEFQKCGDEEAKSAERFHRQAQVCCFQVQIYCPLWSRVILFFVCFRSIVCILISQFCALESS